MEAKKQGELFARSPGAERLGLRLVSFKSLGHRVHRETIREYFYRRAAIMLIMICVLLAKVRSHFVGVNSSFELIRNQLRLIARIPIENCCAGSARKNPYCGVLA